MQFTLIQRMGHGAVDQVAEMLLQGDKKRHQIGAPDNVTDTPSITVKKKPQKKSKLRPESRRTTAKLLKPKRPQKKQKTTMKR